MPEQLQPNDGVQPVAGGNLGPLTRGPKCSPSGEKCSTVWHGKKLPSAHWEFGDANCHAG